MKRVATYIDGFNLYHAISDLREPHLKWLDLFCLSGSLLEQDECLVSVNYFSAFATWKADQYYRHRKYVAALKHAGVSVLLGKFKKKRMRCPSCKYEWQSHEEKETDVNISIHLLNDAIKNRFDVGIVISADSDLAPAVRLAKKETNKKIVVIAPPGRFDRARDLQPSAAITVGRLRQCLFQKTLFNGDGSIAVERPAEYDPP